MEWGNKYREQRKKRVERSRSYGENVPASLLNKKTPVSKQVMKKRKGGGVMRMIKRSKKRQKGKRREAEMKIRNHQEETPKKRHRILPNRHRGCLQSQRGMKMHKSISFRSAHGKQKT